MTARPLARRDRLAARRACATMLDEVARRAGTIDRNHIKPGIAEATRAFLRRVPERLYLRDATDPDTVHLIHLAHLANVPIEPLASGHYRAVTVIGRAA